MEFEDEVSASMAMKKTDGITYKDQMLTVALSNPPPRQDRKGGEKNDIALGGGPRVRKTQVAFVPNAVLRQTQSSSMPPPSTASAPKSNADFRSMLLNRK